MHKLTKKIPVKELIRYVDFKAKTEGKVGVLRKKLNCPNCCGNNEIEGTISGFIEEPDNNEYLNSEQPAVNHFLIKKKLHLCRMRMTRELSDLMERFAIENGDPKPKDSNKRSFFKKYYYLFLVSVKSRKYMTLLLSIASKDIL